MFEFDPARLRSAMSTRGLTGDTLAKRAHINRGVITQALRGPVQQKSATAIVKALKAVKVESLSVDLMKEEDERVGATSSV